MKGKTLKYILILLAVVMSAAACSTTRTLSEGEYRLAGNEVNILNSDDVSPSEVSSYIKQQPKWSPMLYIYNWSNPDSQSFMNRTLRKLGTAPVVFDSLQVGMSVENIEKHLEHIGYYGSKVTSSVSTRKKNVTVSYDIELGRQFIIDSVSFNVPERGEFSADFFADTANVTVRPGCVLSEKALEDESARSSAHMRTLGYYGFTKNHFRFEADTITIPGRLLLTMNVNEYSRNEQPAAARPLRKYYMDKVNLSYPKDLNFREKILRDLTTVHPGDLYDENAINTTYNRLSSVRTFSSVSMEISPSDTNKVDCNILVSRSKMMGFKVNLEGSVNSTGLIGVSPQLNFFHKNLLGGGERLTLGFKGNFQHMINDPTSSNEFGISAGLNFPRFLGLPVSYFKGESIPGTDINLSFSYQDRPEYKRQVLSTSYGFSGNIRKKFLYQLYPLQVNVVKMGGISKDFAAMLHKNPSLKYTFMDHFDAGLGGSLYYTSSAETVPTTLYHWWRLSTDLSGNVLSLFNGILPYDETDGHTIIGLPYSQYVRGELTLGRTWRYGRNNGQAIATRLLAGAGYAYGNSSELPFEKQFYSGGSSSMRGWQARALGPGKSRLNTFFSIPSQTGNLKLEANIEYRFKVFWMVEGALFADAGNVWSQRITLKDTALDWGTGVRVNLSFLIMRIDLGIKLHDPSREQTWVAPNDWFKKDGFAVHFGVGYPF